MRRSKDFKMPPPPSTPSPLLDKTTLEATCYDYPSGSLFLLSKGPLHEDIKTHKNALVVHEM